AGSLNLPTSPYWGQCDVNSGFPFLLWEYNASPCAPPPPPPPPTYPPSAPLDVVGLPSDESVLVSWSKPASSGSFAISTYQVRSTPEGGTCLTADLICEITGLVNGTAYTFEVRALNGAGWGPWSAPSESVTPGPVEDPSIMITGTRGVVRGKPGVLVTGSTTDFGMGAILRPWMRFPGQTAYTEGSASILVDEAGDFTWQRRTGKTIYISIRTEDGSVKSNRLVIRR
ncbi:MAG: fibronectin type III domain-containing protein, partial [Candidatus Nanopelagicales bacterium]